MEAEYVVEGLCETEIVEEAEGEGVEVEDVE